MIRHSRSLQGLIAAELVSFTGSAMTFVALPWFVLVTTGSIAKTGWVLAAEMLPIAIFGIPAGAVIARLGAKRTMLIADAARGPLLMALPILKWTGNLSFGAVLAVTFAVGCFAAPYMSSSRLIIPEAVGDDERGVAQVNAVIGGANQLTQILGPVLAGVLIAATSPPVVLVVDGATYVFSFLAILLFVRVGRRVEQTAQSRGLLAGLRFLAHDRLLGPVMLAACGINLVAQGLIVAVQGLAYFRYGQDAHVVGYLFAAFGIGALAGAVVAQQLAAKVDLLKLAAIAIVAMPLPLWLMSVSMPWELAMLVLACFGFFTPLVNAPLIGVLTVRTPAALRPKVMTSVMTVATIAGPLGFVLAGEALRYVSLTAVFVAIAAGLTVGGIVFATVLLRNRDAPPAPDTSVPAPA
ncbi:MAG TPA: MFS transporter [Gaiellaceae bacterium]|nr:MFS transporter [Gaiellaceae bacterium]